MNVFKSLQKECCLGHCASRGLLPLLAFLLLAFPLGSFGQVHVEHLSSDKVANGEVHSYRVVGASFSAVEKLGNFEKANASLKRFKRFSYDAGSHTVTVEVGDGQDYDERSIRYYLSEAVGALPVENSQSKEEWADDDPRHQAVDHGPVSATPPPTDPATMPDWSHLKPVQNGTSVGDQKGGEQ